MKAKWARALGWSALVLCVGALGFTNAKALLYFLTLLMTWSIFAIGFDLAFGLTGLASFGHAAFFGTGAYVTAILTMRCGLPFSAALIGAGLAAALVAVIFGLISLRISGLFFALTTLAFSGVLYTASSTKLRSITGGLDGLPGVPRPAFWGIDFYQEATYYLFVACIFLSSLGAAAVIRSSPFGQVLKGIRLNEMRAEQIGFDVKLFKLTIFAISGLFSGVAGGLLASLMLFVDANTLHWTTSGDVIIMSLIGGSGTLLGPVLGVACFELLREVLSSYTDHWHGLLGLVFVVYTIQAPAGMMGLIEDGWRAVAKGAR